MDASSACCVCCALFRPPGGLYRWTCRRGGSPCGPTAAAWRSRPPPRASASISLSSHPGGGWMFFRNSGAGTAAPGYRGPGHAYLPVGRALPPMHPESSAHSRRDWPKSPRPKDSPTSPLPPSHHPGQRPGHFPNRYPRPYRSGESIFFRKNRGLYSVPNRVGSPWEGAKLLFLDISRA